MRDSHLIASEITNPLLGAYPDFTEDTRPQVNDAIALGIDVDRAERSLSTLNVYAPKIIEAIHAARLSGGA